MDYVVSGIVAFLALLALFAWNDGWFCQSEMCQLQWASRIAIEKQASVNRRAAMAAPVAPPIAVWRDQGPVHLPESGMIDAGHRRQHLGQRPAPQVRLDSQTRQCVPCSRAGERQDPATCRCSGSVTRWVPME
jgi:hypothetical protein